MSRLPFAVKSTLSILILGALGSGCGSLTGPANKAADNSGKAADAGNRAADAGNKAADNTKQVLNLSNQAYFDGRAAATRERRDAELKNLRDPLIPADVSAKLVPAAAYLGAFEFNFWKADGIEGDDSAARERMFQLAVNEFMKTLVEFKGDGVVTASSTDPKKNVFIAIASVLHSIHSRQTEAAAKYGFTTVSMVDLIGNGLASLKDADSIKDKENSLPKYQQVVHSNADLAIYLFQTRYNALAAAIASLVSDADMAKIKGGEKIKWTPDFAKLPHTKNIMDLSDKLKLALQAKQILGVAGVAAELEPAVKGLYALMDSSVAGTSTGEPNSVRNEEATKALALLPMIIK